MGFYLSGSPLGSGSKLWRESPLNHASRRIEIVTKAGFCSKGGQVSGRNMLDKQLNCDSYSFFPRRELVWKMT